MTMRAYHLNQREESSRDFLDKPSGKAERSTSLEMTEEWSALGFASCYRRDARMLARGVGSGLKPSWLGRLVGR